MSVIHALKCSVRGEGGNPLSELSALSPVALDDPLVMLLCESVWSLRGLLEWFETHQKCPPGSSIVYTALAFKQDAL